MVSFKSYSALLVTVIYTGHIATAMLDCEGDMVVTGWTNSLPGCNMGLLSGSSLAGKVFWVLKECLLVENADYHMLVLGIKDM